MNLNQLTYFVTLAQIENYTRAAKRLEYNPAKSEPCDLQP